MPQNPKDVTYPNFITDFRVARSNRFVAGIFAPFLQNYSVIEIEAAEIPSISISTSEFRYDQSPNISVPYLRSPQAQTSLTIRLDENHKFRKTINEWIEKIIIIPPNLSSTYGYSRNYYNDVIGTVSIYQLNLEGKVTAYTTLLNAYPINIDTIRYDWGESDNFIRMNVTFTYLDAINKYL